jgi:23S rRNA maturation mini-RNase III
MAATLADLGMQSSPKRKNVSWTNHQSSTLLDAIAGSLFLCLVVPRIENVLGTGNRITTDASQGHRGCLVT